jgi:hypothetical protein
VAETPAFVKENKMDQAPATQTFDEKLHVEEMLETKVLKEERGSSPEFVDYDPMTSDPQEDEKEHQNVESLSCKEEYEGPVHFHAAAEEQHADPVGMSVISSSLGTVPGTGTGAGVYTKLKRELRVETVVWRYSLNPDPNPALKN